MPLVFNIQKFSVHDGPGIRTTLFFKGCPIRCLWCHNPESQCYEVENIETKEGKVEVVGKDYTVNELVKEVEKDIIFYEQSGGGVTLSGGEVMTQDMDYVAPLVKKIQSKGISVAVDTCGVAPFENFERILPYVDYFLYDLKFINSQLHKEYTGVGNELVLDNLKKLSEHGATIHLRLILLEGLNTSDEVIEETVAWLKMNNISVSIINLLPYHEFGFDKYKRLGRKDPQLFKAPSEERQEQIKQLLESHQYKVKIGG